MKRFIWLFVAFVIASQASAVEFQEVKDGLLHEAYVVQEFGTLLIEAIPTQPPPRITELKPSADDPQSTWIPGYWGWSRNHGKYLWVSGVWRRPPPDHQWISGYWKNYPEGWIWIRGFWSKINLNNVVYITLAPPDPIDELVPLPPANADDYFWVPGHWQYEEKSSQYVWYSGRWEKIGPHWVFVPPQYIWRETGYVFNPGFWDWPLDDRGLSFSSISIDPKAIDVFVYEPVHALQQLMVMELLYPDWPNYYCLFHYHYYFHYEAWSAWGAVPPWWNWPTWWCLPWQDMWWVWWWWCHPGYPNPSWLNPSIANQIAPPPSFVVKMMEPIRPPVNVTPRGVVGTRHVLKALQTLSGKNRPILPSDPRQVEEIQKLANPSTTQPSYYRPQGSGTLTQPVQKPFFGLGNERLKAAPQRTVLPPVPPLSPSMPTQSSKQATVIPHIPDPQPSPVSQTDSPELPSAITTPQTPEESQSSHSLSILETPYTDLPPPTELAPPTPRAHAPIRTNPTLPAERAIPQPRKPPYYFPTPELHPDIHMQEMAPHTDRYTSRRPPPPYRIPNQNYYTPYYRRPLTPMETEHHDYFMSQPMQQINPEGPKAYEVPGDYSTLPGQ